MHELAQMHCTKISENTQRFTQSEIEQYLSRLPQWYVTLKEGELRLEKEFKFKDFNQAIDFTNRVAKISNDEDHHPAILVEWGKAAVYWWTHKIRGLHQNDFIMAAKTEKLYEEIK